MRTDVGKRRLQNEDAAWFHEKRGVFAVADGMGGHKAGEVASGLAIGAVRRMAAARRMPGIAAIKEAVDKAQTEIARHVQKHPECMDMGTTLSMMMRGSGFMYIAHIGDSRIYRLREGIFEQITQDHSLVSELVRAGLITKEEARTHPRRNIITRALGTQGDGTPDLLATDARPSDLWLLCTDGLTGMVPDEAICDVLMRYDIEEAADRLIAMALAAGGTDNVTLVLYRSEEG